MGERGLSCRIGRPVWYYLLSMSTLTTVRAAALLERRLARSGADGESERVRRWMDASAVLPLGAERRLRRIAAACPCEFSASLRGWWRGAVGVCLGRYVQARPLLRSAEGPFLAWKAEAELQARRPEEAVVDAGRLRSVRPSDARGWHLAAMASASLGRTEEALEVLRKRTKSEPKDAVAWALSGLYEGRLGRAGKARECADRAVRLRRRAGWPLALRAIGLGAGTSEEALADLDRAARLEPSAWVHRLKAEGFIKAGLMEAAVPELDRAVRLNPRSAGLQADLGRGLAMMKQYPRAVRAYDRAIRWEPERAEFRSEAAHVFWMAGERRRAVREMDRCAELEPSPHRGRLEALWLRIRMGGDVGPRLRRLLRSRDPVLRAGARFLSGMAHLRRGRWAKAASQLEQGAANLPEGFDDVGYLQLARSLQIAGKEHSMPKKRTRKAGDRGSLLVAGLGLDDPRQATLETLRALSECDVVFNNTYGQASARLIETLCRDVRVMTYQTDGEERPWVRRIFAEMRPGRRVGFVTRGHPLVSGNLAHALLKRAGRDGVSTRCLAAVSSVDQMLALSQEVFQETSTGLQVHDAEALVREGRTPDPTVPLLLFPEAGGGLGLERRIRRNVDGLCVLLSRLYSPSHPVLWLGPRVGPRTTQTVPLKELGGRLLEVPAEKFAGVVLYLSPVPGGRKRPRGRKR